MLKAIYTFKGSHNDELNFKKGDVITLTQKEDGGWWEGTLDGKTGWFPSNYVKEINPDVVNGGSTGLPVDKLKELQEKQIDYRQQVIKDIIDKEREFVQDLKTLYKDYLNPFHNPDWITEVDFRNLAGNIDELIEVHTSLYHELDSNGKLPPRDQRVGRTLLHHGSSIKSAHETYWSNHPKAVLVLEKYRDSLNQFVESLGVEKPGLVVLTALLSKPFRHLEKFSSVAQELEKHMEDDHPDRGDTQRSVNFYKSVSSECARLRRQKELELEVMNGVIRNWEGDSISSYGDVLHMGSVAIGSERNDRYLVLFKTHLVILSVSSRMSAFIYEGKLPLSGIAVNRLEDTESIRNSFEITGPMIERILVVCQTKPESLKWVEILHHYIRQCRQANSSSANSALNQIDVSDNCQPLYQVLTNWIRSKLSDGTLQMSLIRKYTRDQTLIKRFERYMTMCKLRQHTSSRSDKNFQGSEVMVHCTDPTDSGDQIMMYVPVKEGSNSLKLSKRYTVPPMKSHCKVFENSLFKTLSLTHHSIYRQSNSSSNSKTNCPNFWNTKLCNNKVLDSSTVYSSSYDGEISEKSLSEPVENRVCEVEIDNELEDASTWICHSDSIRTSVSSTPDKTYSERIYSKLEKQNAFEIDSETEFEDVGTWICSEVSDSSVTLSNDSVTNAHSKPLKQEEYFDSKTLPSNGSFVLFPNDPSFDTLTSTDELKTFISCNSDSHSLHISWIESKSESGSPVCAPILLDYEDLKKLIVKEASQERHCLTIEPCTDTTKCVSLNPIQLGKKQVKTLSPTMGINDSTRSRNEPVVTYQSTVIAPGNDGETIYRSTVFAQTFFTPIGEEQFV